MKRNNSGIILILDFKKTYDRVNWDFLWYVMDRMGFGDRWIKWIRRCVTCAKVSILLNGSLDPGFNRGAALDKVVHFLHSYSILWLNHS